MASGIAAARSHKSSGADFRRKASAVKGCVKGIARPPRFRRKYLIGENSIGQ